LNDRGQKYSGSQFAPPHSYGRPQESFSKDHYTHRQHPVQLQDSKKTSSNDSSQFGIDEETKALLHQLGSEIGGLSKEKLLMVLLEAANRVGDTNKRKMTDQRNNNATGDISSSAHGAYKSSYL